MLDKFRLNRFQSITIFSTLLFLGVFILIPIVYLSILEPKSIYEQDIWVPSQVKNSPNELLDQRMSSDSIPLYYQFLDFDPTTGYLETNIYVWPSEDLSNEFSSATIPYIPIRLFFDNLYSKTSYNFSPGESIGAIKVALDSTNPLDLERGDEFYYPFDQYSLDSYAKIEKGNSRNKDFSPAKTYEFFWEPQISNFKFDILRGSTFQDTYNWLDDEAYSRNNVFSQRDRGEISTLIVVSRTNSVKFASILIFSSILVSSFALIFTSFAVARTKRPPSLTALVWSSALILGIIQLRDLLPGKPRIGILLDSLVFFPSIGLCILSVIILSATWIRQKDYAI